MSALVLLPGVCGVRAADSQPRSIPIRAVVPDLNGLQKWDDTRGDTADPFWADDDNLYHFTCDGCVNLKVDDFPRLAQIPVFRAEGLPAGSHPIRIVNCGSDWVTVDAFVVTTSAVTPRGVSSDALTGTLPAAIQVKGQAPTYLFGGQASAREGDIRRQAGDNFRWRGTGRLAWQVQVDQPGEYEVSLCHAAEPGAVGQSVQVRAGDQRIHYTLTRTQTVFPGKRGYELLPLPGTLRLEAGVQTVTLSVPDAPKDLPILAFRSLALTLVAAQAAIEADRQEAQRARASTEWLARAGYGLMFHWTSQSIGRGGTHKPFAQAVAEFDLNRFVSMVETTGAGYVLFTIGHAEPYCPAPLASWEKYHPGHTTQRDLIAEMADALQARGIRLMCYFPVHVIGKYPQAGVEEFRRIMTEIMTEFGGRYQEKVAGYWFDGCYQSQERYPDFSFRQFFQVCKAGNPDRIIALNAWVYPNISQWQEYWAGETTSPVALPVHGTMERGPGAGLRYQALLIMEPYWVQQKAAMPKPRFSAQALGNYIRQCRDNGGAVTINLGIYQDGSVDPNAVQVLQEVRQLVRGN